MAAPHWDSNPGSVEVSKRALPVSAGKETQKEHAQKTKVSAVMVSVDHQVLFGGQSAGSLHAPPVEAVLASTCNEKDNPPRLPPASTTVQQSAQQHATVATSVAIGSPAVPAQQQKSHRRCIHRDRLPQQRTPSKLHNSTLRRLPLLEKPPPRNPAHKNKKMCGHQTTKSTAMAPLTR